MKILKLEFGETPQRGNLEEMCVGDKIEIHGINQGLPEEDYKKFPYGNFARTWRRWIAPDKIKISLPVDKHGKRYILIERKK